MTDQDQAATRQRRRQVKEILAAELDSTATHRAPDLHARAALDAEEMLSQGRILRMGSLVEDAIRGGARRPRPSRHRSGDRGHQGRRRSSTRSSATRLALIA